MTVTIGTTTFANLTAQPFGYESSDTKAGLTARQWSINGLLTPSEWLDVLDEYNTWRDLRIQDEDTTISYVIGTTINFSGNGAGGATWTNIPCWFSEPPAGEQAGGYLRVSFVVVDAAEALEVLVKQQETEEGTATGDDLPDFGTYTLAGIVLTLKKPVDSYLEGPQLQLTTLGYHYVSGPKVVQKTKDIEGYFDTSVYPSGLSTIRTWYESQITSTPSSGAYFPTSVPSFSGEKIITGGVTGTRYTVSIVLAQVI
jgi:hypothetical protein